jgi:hypothetical protein
MKKGQILAARSRAQGLLETLFPADVTIPGYAVGTLRCAGGTLKQTGARLVGGGQIVDCDLVFRIRTALLSAQPAIGKRLTFGGQDWRIVQVTTPQTDVAYVVYCDNPNK